MKTNEEIEAEIKALTEIKPRVRRETAFGEDNHVAIDAQIRVLRDEMTEEDVIQAHEEINEWETEHAYEAARDAAQWLAGKLEESLSESWAAIAK